MKNGIPSKIYYSLLEWKDEHLEEFISMFGHKKLCEFTAHELLKMNQAIEDEQKEKEKERGMPTSFR
jgi:hypothetical protein